MADRAVVCVNKKNLSPPQGKVVFEFAQMALSIEFRGKLAAVGAHVSAAWCVILILRYSIAPHSGLLLPIQNTG